MEQVASEIEQETREVKEGRAAALVGDRLRELLDGLVVDGFEDDRS